MDQEIIPYNYGTAVEEDSSLIKNRLTNIKWNKYNS